ncbi:MULTISPECIES: hypothetical protein [unclassified Streptomyces]|uniref:hypothetical protein n=1 Tax=unclassified Streptomyces TaxID=2593676 RepID=UPI000BEF7EC6|nr:MULTISPECIES: hypothetical protein [unclassified Streptomyces]
MRAWLLRRIQAATAANLLRLAEELERQAPHPELRSSRGLPTPEELPAVLARIDNGWRERCEPEFGYRRHAV